MSFFLYIVGVGKNLSLVKISMQAASMFSKRLIPTCTYKLFSTVLHDIAQTLVYVCIKMLKCHWKINGETMYCELSKINAAYTCVASALCNIIWTNFFDLLLHSFDLILPWFHLPPQLLDLVVQHKLKLLQLLVFLLQVIDTFFLWGGRGTVQRVEVLCTYERYLLQFV